MSTLAYSVLCVVSVSEEEEEEKEKEEVNLVSGINQRLHSSEDAFCGPRRRNCSVVSAHNRYEKTEQLFNRDVTECARISVSGSMFRPKYLE